MISFIKIEKKSRGRENTYVDASSAFLLKSNMIKVFELSQLGVFN